MAGESNGKPLPVAMERMRENFGSRLRVSSVLELKDEEAIFVEDGNHGENRPRQDEFADTGVAFIKPPDLKNGRVDFDKCARINEAGFNRVRKGIATGGDIILTHRATVGRIAITTKDDPDVFVTNPGTTVYRSTNPDLLDQRYLYCFMRSPAFMQQLWGEVGNNSTFDYVSLTQQRSLRIGIPPLPEQRAIASILGALDDKIELNRRMNATLESLARAIFKSWFVDFDPVRMKSEGGRVKSESSDSAPSPFTLPPSLFNLFPSSFQDSELGQIPTGWSVSKLSEFASVSSGKRPPLKSKVETAELRCPVYGGGGLMAYTAAPLSSDRFLLTGRVGTLGDIYRITDPIWASDNTLLVRPNNDAHLDFLYFHMCGLDLENLNRGSTQPLLTQTDLKNQEFVTPTEDVIDQFDFLVSPLFAKRKVNERESLTLSTLRDTLLPKLLSGELPVPAALTGLVE